jgi:hypothetical protein
MCGFRKTPLHTRLTSQLPGPGKWHMYELHVKHTLTSYLYHHRTGRKGPYAHYYVQIQPNGGSFVGKFSSVPLHRIAEDVAACR